MSADFVQANAAFAEKHNLPFPLLSDTNREVCRAYGACHDSNGGKIRRNSYIIGPDGTILRVYENVSPEEQAETILAFLSNSPHRARPEHSPSNQDTSNIKVAMVRVAPQKGEQGNMDDQQKNEVENGQVREAMMINAQGATDYQPATPDGTGVEQTVAASKEAASSSLPVEEKVSTVVPGQVYPAKDGGAISLVFALGNLGYDFGSEARRDSLMQHMDGNPNDPTQLLAYFEKNPDQAAAVIWTLNLDATPMYAVLPHGPYASTVYERLRQFLREHLTEGVERVSIPGVIAGQVRLMSGQTVPMIIPELRCMYSWSTAALIEAVCGKAPSKSAKAEEQEAFERKTEAVTNFLQRIYHELRNLGLTSQERAMNYAGVNVANANNIFESALKRNLELHSIDVALSPICRPDSDCWDVKLLFFDPENVLRAKAVYQFTVDVSDVCPVMVGPVRSWSMP